MRIAVLGSGLTALSLLRSLPPLPSLSISVFDPGRLPGGRASTRRSREDPALEIDHGAPGFAVRANSPAARLLAGLDLEGWASAEGASADGAGLLSYSPPAGVPADALAARLRTPSPSYRPSTLVTSLSPLPGGGWSLSAGSSPLGDFDVVVVTSLTPAHPRWEALFGTPPPLPTAAAALPNGEAVRAFLSELALVRYSPALVSLLLLPPGSPTPPAPAGHPVLARAVARTLGDGRVALALHSTGGYASRPEHARSHGGGGAAARSGARGGGRDAGEVAREMFGEYEKVGGGGTPGFGPELHRWGAANVEEGTLRESGGGWFPEVGLVFAGDYFGDGGEGGGVERAMNSGVEVGTRLGEWIREREGGGGAEL